MRDIINNSPTIRFPDFKEVWTTREFKDLVKRSSDKINTDSLSNFKCIELDSIEKHSGRLLKIYDQNTSFRSVKNMFETNDVLVGKLRPKLRKFYYATFDGCCSTEIWVFKSLGSISKFIYYLIQTPKFQQISTVTFGSKMPRSDWYYISEYPFFLPSLPEQQKIADFLTIVDKKIQALEKKKALLEQYKKGVMQKVFKQEIRFKQEDGSDYPEWEEKRLGELAIVTMGQSPSSTSYNNENLGIPLIQGNADIIKRKTKPRQYTTEPTKKIAQGELIMTVRAPSGYIAKSYHNACIGRGVCSIGKSKGNLNFLYYYLLWFEPRWVQFEQGSTFTAISGNDIRNLVIKAPKDNEEKTNIGKFLTSIDNKINTVLSQIDKTKEWKKGLLQQIFV